MKVINLVSLKDSWIKYSISQFPDGQQDIILHGHPIAPLTDLNTFKNHPVTIKSRFNSFKDLELIIATNKALRRLGVKEIYLDIPYLLGARSDRQFQEGGNSYLVDVIAPILNAQQFDSIKVLDVHSDVAAACIKNLVVESNKKLVNWAVSDICRNESLKEIIAISPDAGALKKIYNSTESLAIITDVIVASKVREPISGKITSTEVPLEGKIFGADSEFVIIDDICDGGRTFIEIAKVIKSSLSHSKIHLIITHGIFSAGFTELMKYFSTIYTTNSVKDVGGLDGNTNKVIKIKQFKII